MFFLQKDDAASGFIQDKCGNLAFDITDDGSEEPTGTGPDCDLTCTNVEDADGDYLSKGKK